MKLKLPKATLSVAVPHGISFEVTADALSRWNQSVVAKDEKEDDEESISIYDPIGASWDGSGVTAKRIAGALRAIGKKKNVVVNINSPGGNVFEALAIYNLLRDHEGTVTTRVVGLAASAASVIAMAGDKIQVARAGFFMIHNAWIIAMGNRNELREAADFVEQFDDALAGIYAARTGIDKAKVAKLMDKETWMSGETAIEDKFADELLPADQVEEKEETDAEKEANASVRAAEIALVRAGMTRSQARAHINKIRGGTPGAAPADEGGTPGAAPDATPGAGEAAEAVQRMQQFLNNIGSSK